MQTQHAIFGGSQQFSETPSQADISKHSVKHGDIVVFATDGVWDNLSPMDTLNIVTRVMNEGGFWFQSHNFPGAETMLNSALISSLPTSVTDKDAETYLPGLLATAIMREAKVAGLDRRRESPFAKEVNMRYPQEGWEGGKPDDIAVVVCVVVDGSVGVEKREAETRDRGEDKPIKAKL
jgi:protein phosphatase PTC7